MISGHKVGDPRDHAPLTSPLLPLPAPFHAHLPTLPLFLLSALLTAGLTTNRLSSGLFALAIFLFAKVLQTFGILFNSSPPTPCLGPASGFAGEQPHPLPHPAL